MRARTWCVGRCLVIVVVAGTILWSPTGGTQAGSGRQRDLEKARAEGGGLAGGVKLAPVIVSADRTPFVVPISVWGLRQSSMYSVKIRLRSATDAQFGSTFNRMTGRWVSSSAAWASQTTMTAGSDGYLSGWLAARAGTKSAQAHEGTATIGVVLRREDAGSNVEAPAETTVSVIAPGGNVGLGWMHGPVAGVLATESAGMVVARDAKLRVVGLTWSEPNGVDDDDNGLVDDESLGDASAFRSFRLAAPSFRLLAIEGPGTTRWSNQVTFPGADLRVPREGRSTRLTLAATPSVVDWLGRARLAAVLEASPDQTITIEKSGDGLRWTKLAELRTDATGRVVRLVAPTSTLLYRAVWLGTPVLIPAVSRGLRVGVRPAITAGLRRRVVIAGRRVFVSGIFRPTSRRRPLAVFMVRRGSRRRIRVAKVVAVGGRYRCWFAPRSAGRFRVWVQFAGDRMLARGYASAGWLSVRRP